MDKEKTCPKSKNATLSLFTVFYVGRKKWEQTMGDCGKWEKQWEQTVGG
jgi:hypothetical protein